MGQSSSRQERSSPDRRPRPRSVLLRPASILPGLTDQPSVSQRSRRHSAAVTSSLLAPLPPPSEDGQPQPALRRRSRLSRSHSALTSGFPNIFTRRSSSSQHHPSPQDSHTQPYQPRGHSLTPLGTPPPRLQMPDFDAPLDLPALTTPRSALSTDFTFRRSQNSPPSRDRLTPTSDRGFRSVSASLRRRRSPLRRHEDTSAMLTRLLSAAAAATAMSLTGGNTDETIDNLHSDSGGIDGDDGSFNGFLQSLSSGRLATTLGQSHPAEGSSEDIQGQPASLEFFRMFRFGSAHGTRRRTARSNSRPSSSQSADEMSGASSNGGADGNDAERMVPVLIVGIRALNERDATQERTEGMPSFLDSLTTVPGALSLDQGEAPTSQEPESSGLERRRSRRSTIGGLNFFSHDRNGSRQEDRSRPATSQASPSDSPPGPLPPPGTPASPGLSALSSASTTPARRSSMSSIAELSGTPSRRESLYRRLAGTSLEPTLEEQQTSSENPQFRPRGLRRRPRINSWASGPRHDTRRNGMLMEPSNDAPNESSSTRSWIIYILGGNYPENHPILTTPSLFTDSPTYEDMLLLSTLLGSAKPPVATAEDVASAGGLFTIKVVEGSTIAQEVEGEDRFDVPLNDRCQICLSDYVVDEEMRKLKSCGHTFHRECVDQWITTANNSCPLCRAQGVAESQDSATDTAVDDTNAPMTPPFTAV